MKVFNKGVVMATALAATVLVGVGCGSSGGSSSTADKATSTPTTAKVVRPAPKSDSMPNPGLTGPMEQGGTIEADAIKAGQAAAEAAGGPVSTLPVGKKVGFLQIIGGIESADSMANSTRLALETLGYSVLYCDGKGDPTIWVTCGKSLLNQGVEAIFQTGIDSASIASVVTEAKAKNVPIIAIGGLTPGFSGNYAPDETKQGTVAADYMVKALSSLTGEVDIASQSYPAPWAAARGVALVDTLKGTPNIKITQKSVADPTKLLESTKSTVTTWLTQNPKLKALWFEFDVAGAAGGQQAGQIANGKVFPDAPLVVTFHAEPSTQALIKAGSITAVENVNYQASSWIGVDQYAEYMARKTPFSTELMPEYAGIGNGYSFSMVDKSNVDKVVGKYIATEADVVSFFKAKWKAEFGL